MRDARKFILIPEYAPLYAMRECFGPEQAPLTEPTPTPVDIIGKLLLQSGREKITIYEVVKEGKSFSKPVQLTLENYRLPYEQIAGITPVNTVAAMEDITPAAPVEPVMAEEDPIQEDEPEQEQVPEVERKVAVLMVDEDLAAVTKDIEAEEESIEDVTTEAESDPAGDAYDPYAGMSKAQRKKARREEAIRKAAAEAAKEVDA